MKLRNLPLWAEVVAGLVVWTMAASAIVLWILPVPGVIPAAARSPSSKTPPLASPSATETAWPATRVEPLTSPPAVAWTLDASDTLGSGARYTSPDQVADGVSAPIDAGSTWIQGVTTYQLEGDLADSERRIEGIAAASGKVIWTLNARDGIFSCASRLKDGQLPCFERVGTSRAEGNNIVLIDPKSGTRTHTIELRTDGMAMSRVEPIEGGYVIAGRDNTGGGLMASRLDDDGKVTWAASVPIPEETRDATQDNGSRRLQIAGDLVVVSLSFFTQVFRLSDGAVVSGPSELGWVSPDGAVIFQHMEPDSGTSSNAKIMLAGAPDRIVAADSPMVEGPSTLLADGVVAVQISPDTFQAFNSRTGAQLWRSKLGAGRQIVATDDSWVLSDWLGGRISGIDIASGRLVWERKVPEQTYVSSGVSDGERVIAMIGSTLTAIDPKDGSTVWTQPLTLAPDPDGSPLAILDGVGGRIVVSSGPLMIAMGGPQ